MIGINSAEILRRTDEMLQLCQKLSESNSPEVADELLAVWQSCRDYFSLSIHQSDIDRAESALFSIIEARSDPTTQNIQLRIFAAAIRQMAESQRFHFFSIF